MLNNASFNQNLIYISSTFYIDKDKCLNWYLQAIWAPHDGFVDHYQ